jgi:hypothetical protein
VELHFKRNALNNKCSSTLTLYTPKFVKTGYSYYNNSSCKESKSIEFRLSSGDGN